MSFLSTLYLLKGKSLQSHSQSQDGLMGETPNNRSGVVAKGLIKKVRTFVDSRSCLARAYYKQTFWLLLLQASLRV